MKKPAKTMLREVTDVGADWDRWADGRAFRLKRKRHFADVDPALVGQAAEAAAARMGKAVLTSRDRLLPHKYVWVQFADHRVGPDEPCPCGSRRLLRVHANFLRCPACKAQLLLSDQPSGPRETRAMTTLRSLSNVHLERRGDGSARHLVLYRGYARQGEELVFLLVDFKRDEEEDEEVTVENAFDRVRVVRVVPFRELADVFDVQSVEPGPFWSRESHWDLVW